MLRFFLIFLFCIQFLFSATASQASSVLVISNKMDREIINILVQPEKKGKEFFLRLDLGVNKTAKVDNPDCNANLRIDTGLDLIYFSKIPLAGAKGITFLGEDFSLLIERDNKGSVKFIGKRESMIPRKGERIVCELHNFHPNMPMRDVCKIVPAQTPVDDNDALLTGIGFGGMPWAGRLAPEHLTSSPEDALLEHMELWRPFSSSDVFSLLRHLYANDYVPWQAEFPDADLDFADMPDKNPADQQNALFDVLNRYILRLEEKPGDASIMFAQKGTLDALANADAPEKDVQLFTLLLKPASNTMILDVAAYQANPAK